MSMVVQGPGDIRVSFPDGTDAATIDGVMRQAAAPDRGAGEAGLNQWANQTLGGFGPQVGGVIQGTIDALGGTPAGGADRAAPGTPVPRTVADLAQATRTEPWTPLERQIVGPDAPEPGSSLPKAPSIGSFTGGYNRFVDNANQNLVTEAAQHPIASGVGSLAGGLTSASMVPGATIARGLGIAGKAGTVAAKVGEAVGSGLGYGAISGAGNARGTAADRLKGGLEGALTGGVTGAALGTPMALAGNAMAARAAAMAARPGTSAAVAAAERAGVRVPAAIASDNLAVQQLGGAAKSIPYFGTRMVDAAKQTVSDFGRSAGKVAADYGGGIAANPASSGAAARDALVNWVGPLTKDAVSHTYDEVDALVDPAVTTPLNATARVATGIVTANKAATLPPGSAVQMVREAVSRPAGLTYQGIKDLRTHVGELIDAGPMPGNPAQGELKRIYGALTTDLRTSVGAAGGPAASAAFDKANLLNAAVAKRRTELMQILGVNRNNPASAEDVFSTIKRMAGSTSAADAATLVKVKKSMPPAAWDGIASAVVGDLGKSPATGEISIDKFFTDYNNISAAGKAALFGGRKDLASALDDLSVVAGHTKKALKTFSNPSGTAQVSGLLGLGYAATNPLLWPKIAAGAIGAHYLTRALSNPATVRSMAAWAKTYQRWLARPSQILGQSLQFSARRLAGEIGQQFGLRDRVGQMAHDLQGSAASANDQRQK